MGKSVLCLSSSMGLGHVTRDLAVMQALRKRRPDIEVVWLTAHPNTMFLQEAGEALHPASSSMQSQSEIAEKMAQPGFKYNSRIGWEQTLVAQQRNTEVLGKVLMDGKPDLIYADESFEVLFLLLKYPKLKQWPLVWLTDTLTGSASPENLRMIVQSFQALKNQGLEPIALLYVGTEEDIPNRPMGEGLPTFKAYFQENFKAIGYILSFDSEALRREGRKRLKSRLGYSPDRKLILASIGGTGIGRELLERVDQAASEFAAVTEGELEIVLVCGPRLPPENLHVTQKNVQVHGYVPRLYEHFAAADFAVIEGGLTSAVELAAVGTPFVYVPLSGHVEQEM
jgi:UDP-N-acetylglucosamine:LPS N-acetylglucosamine transferase